MCLLFKKFTAIVELVQKASGQCYCVLKMRARSSAHSDAITGEIIGSVFLPWEMHSPLFMIFYVRYQNLKD